MPKKERNYVDPLVIRKAQEGDSAAKQRLIDESGAIVAAVLKQYGISPSPHSVGEEGYRDIMGEINLFILKRLLSNFSIDKGAAWETYLYRSVDNFVKDILSGSEGSALRTLEEQYINPGQSVSLSETMPVKDPTDSGITYEETISDPKSGVGAQQVSLMLDSVKQQLSPVDQMILEYRVLGFTPADISQYFLTNGIKTPRGGQYDTRMITKRWSEVIKPILEEYFPEAMRSPSTPTRTPYEKEQASPSKQYPVYRIDPETGERTEMVSPQESQPENVAEGMRKHNINLYKKSKVLDILDYLQIAILYDEL